MLSPNYSYSVFDSVFGWMQYSAGDSISFWHSSGPADAPKTMQIIHLTDRRTNKQRSRRKESRPENGEWKEAIKCENM